MKCLPKFQLLSCINWQTKHKIYIGSQGSIAKSVMKKKKQIWKTQTS